MNVLVAFEMSGVVREAFRKRGHNAYSLDILPSLDGSPYHIQDDWGSTDPVRDWHLQPWDLLIAHPPCTYLASSGLHWNKRRPERAALTDLAVQLVKDISNSRIPRIAIENPIGALSTRFRKPDQIIQPWQFGHNESKSTCLWLTDLPLLQPTNIIELPECGYRENQTPSGQNKLGPSADRQMKRSITYQGIADAMADSWGILGNELENTNGCTESGTKRQA